MGISVMGHMKSLKSGAAIVAEDSTRVRGRARDTDTFPGQIFGHKFEGLHMFMFGLP
jgi:hypothetical protein